jgi:ABC-type lipoprotein export system ATPase subunit
VAEKGKGVRLSTLGWWRYHCYAGGQVLFSSPPPLPAPFAGVRQDSDPLNPVSRVLYSAMLQLENVQKSYLEPGGQRLPILALKRLSVGRAEQVVLRGSSGSGKTTLLGCISGLMTVDQGTITVNGHEVTRMIEVVRDRFRAQTIGYVFQTFNLLPGFSALENVLLGMTFTGKKPDIPRAKRLLDRLGLSSRLAHKPDSLSVGECQRVGVARALANQPRLLLADEPTANVDPGHQQQIVDLLREACQEEQIAMLLVTHSEQVSSQFDRVERLEEINEAGS